MSIFPFLIQSVLKEIGSVQSALDLEVERSKLQTTLLKLQDGGDTGGLGGGAGVGGGGEETVGPHAVAADTTSEKKGSMNL